MGYVKRKKSKKGRVKSIKKPLKGKVIRKEDWEKRKAKNTTRTQVLTKSGIKRIVPWRKKK